MTDVFEEEEVLEEESWVCPVDDDCDELRLCGNCYHNGKYTCPNGNVSNLSNISCERFSCKYLKAETMAVSCTKEEK